MNRAQKKLLAGLYRAALLGVDPSRAVSAALAEPAVATALGRARRVGVFAVGKAATGMYRGAAGVGEAALIVLPKGYSSAGTTGADVLFASHPEPDRSSVVAARRAISFFREFGPDDVILCLVSGGTSSLLCLPRPALTLPEKRRRIRRLTRSGASILELNRLRIALSAVKGGKLGRRTAARLATLVISDVPGDAPGMVGSGPTIRGTRGDLVRVVASNRLGLEAAAHEAKRRGLRVRFAGERLSGEACRAGRKLARAAAKLDRDEVILAGGETTVTLGRRYGRGGRSLELALCASLATTKVPGIAILAAGSDGRDGSSEAAGAFADSETQVRARRLGLSPEDVLARHDTEPFFEALDDLFVTGPTGTNVADWVFAYRASRA